MEKKMILLIEDNPDDRDLTLRALKRSQIPREVIIAKDGVQALQLLHDAGQSEPLPDLVLLDLKLPRLDGHTVLSRIRRHQRTRYIPVVVLSSSDEQSDVRKSYDLGANGYIQKPVDFDQFMEAVRQLNTYWLEWNLVPAGG
ncbi:response regulator [bacterium]|nr:response regulator [candidate division CSSED10-310 bacterium]